MLNKIFKGKSYNGFLATDIMSDHMAKLVGQYSFEIWSDNVISSTATGRYIYQHLYYEVAYHFHKGQFIFQNLVFWLKKNRSPSFQDHNFLWPGHFLPDPVIPINNGPSLSEAFIYCCEYGTIQT